MGSEEARVSSPSPSSSPQLDSRDKVSDGGVVDSSRDAEARTPLSQPESARADRDSNARVFAIKEEETSDSDRGSGEFYAARPRMEESRASSDDSGSKGFDVEDGGRVAEVKTEDVRFAGDHVVEYSGTGPGGIDGGFEGKFTENDAGAGDGSSFVFEAGDMVWGKVKSHPWWPGHVYNEAFATSSVRRTRREGHVLVAFFGDSSYGWFNPAELIPFEPHYAEKSCQTNSRTFMKAVEEAVDETKRRRALGLACRCRNKFNFKPASVKGYFAVDVEDYDPGMVYSAKQINKAREKFQPVEMLSFVQQLALAPRDVDEHPSLHCMQDAATVLAYRKAVFEEFDETYAQAFGIQPERPSRKAEEIQQSDKVLPRAPLSGPLVIAENLGERKRVMKSLKPKKDKYLFKRREDPDDHRTTFKPRSLHVSQMQSGVLHSSALKETLDTYPAQQGEYILQRRAPAVTEKHTVSASQPPEYASSLVTQGSGGMHLDSAGHRNDIMPEASTLSDKPIVLEKRESVLETGIAESASIDGEVKSKKAVKRPGEESSSEKSVMVEKKKKKKKGLGMEVNAEHKQKHKSGDFLRKSSGKSVTSGLVEHQQVEMQKTDDGAGGILSSPGPTISAPKADNGTVEIELPQVVSDLLVLALDPFHGIERNGPEIVRHVFLRFRSLVYQKSLVLPPASEPETSEVRASKTSVSRPLLEPGVGNAESSPGGERREPSSALKSSKHVPRSDDPTKMGRKRGPSDRQEEISAKRMKKLKDMKALVAEKKAGGQKTAEVQKGEHKEMIPATKLVKPAETLRKSEPAAKAVVPTALMIKFPPKTALPSHTQLKARFARFGPLDLSGIRVYWKSLTCRVVFKHKSDAEAAYDHAIKNNSMFEHVSVRYYVKEIEAPPSEMPEANHQRMEDDPDDSLQPKLGGSEFLSEPRSVVHRLPQPALQLKSCLKKPSGEEVGGAAKDSPRVKFLLGGEESRKGEQLGTFSNNNNNTNADGLSSQPFDVSSAKNTKSTVILQPPLQSPFPTTATANANTSSTSTFPPLPLRLPDMNVPGMIMAGDGGGHLNHMPPNRYGNYGEVEGKNGANVVDISHQMLSLLMRCSDIVTDVNRALGYVPYHPL